MAKRDIAGFLTGMPSNYAETMLESGSLAGDVMGGRLKGMLGGGKTVGLSPREEMQKGVRNFNKLDTQGKRDLIGRLQASGETSLAGQLASQLKADLQKVKTEAGLVKQAEDAELVASSLPPEYSQLSKAIQGNVTGALAKGIEILGRKKAEAEQPKGEKPTTNDITSAKKALSLAGEEAKGGEGFFAFLDTDWRDAWNNQTETAQDLLATQVAEVTNKLIDGGMDLSQARKLAIKKMYTDNLTETGLFEWGESRMMNADEIAEKQKQELEAKLNRYQ